MVSHGRLDATASYRGQAGTWHGAMRLSCCSLYGTLKCKLVHHHWRAHPVPTRAARSSIASKSSTAESGCTRLRAADHQPPLRSSVMPELPDDVSVLSGRRHTAPYHHARATSAVEQLRVHTVFDNSIRA